MDSDSELLTRVVKSKDFFRSVLQSDSLDDWNLAKGFGEFLVRIEPEEAMGHALLARAYRHLGDSDRAREELERCRCRVKSHQVAPSEIEMFLSFLAKEQELSGGPAPEKSE